MISVTDQSPLAEILGHSGSRECRSEELDICTAVHNESSPSMNLSAGGTDFQSTGLTMSVSQFVYYAHE